MEYLNGIEEHFKTLQENGYVLNDTRFQYLKRYNYLLMQLHDARISLELSERSNKYETKGAIEEVILQQALFRNSVMNYSKCFSASGKGMVSLDKKKVFKNNSHLLAIHEKVMQIRNKFVAHNDNSGIDVANIAVKEDESIFSIKHLYSMATPLNEYKFYQMLFEHCESHLIKIINCHLNSLEESYGKSIVLK